MTQHQEHYDGPERRSGDRHRLRHTFSDAEIETLVEAIAERAAEIAVKKAAESFYSGIGRSIVTKVMMWIGLFVVGYMSARGIPKL